MAVRNKKMLWGFLGLLVLFTLGIALFVTWQLQNTTSVGQSTQQMMDEYQIDTKEIGFESNGNQIYGIARIPKDAGEVPTVVFAHGFGGNHDQELALQNYLASHGIAVYAIDFAGGTGYNGGNSEGQMTDMSVLTEREDLLNAVATIKKEEFVDSQNIFLLGASQGGVVSSLAAVELADQVRGLMLLYPAFSLFDDSHARFSEVAEIPETVNLMGLTVGRKYFEDVWDLDIFQEIAGFQGNTIIFHGTADSIVPDSYSERASQAFENVEFHSIDGAGHGFSKEEQNQVAQQLVEFMRVNQN